MSKALKNRCGHVETIKGIAQRGNDKGTKVGKGHGEHSNGDLGGRCRK